MVLHKQFAFIMLKPAAAHDLDLTNYLKKELLKYGDIKYFRDNIIVDKSSISEHYKASQTNFWYPFIINYLTNKSVKIFILESTIDKDNFDQFLKKQVIGSANLFKTEEFHLRRLAFKKFPLFLVDNLIHCSDSTQAALAEIRIWYKNEPDVIREFTTKALALEGKVN